MVLGISPSRFCKQILMINDTFFLLGCTCTGMREHFDEEEIEVCVQCVCVCVRARACVCVCVIERERESMHVCRGEAGREIENSNLKTEFKPQNL